MNIDGTTLILFFLSPPFSAGTLLIAEILSGKNVRAWVSMDFTQDKFSAPIAIKKMTLTFLDVEK